MRTIPTTFPVVADRDGIAVLGRTRHDLMGIRYAAGDGGAASAADASTTADQTAAGSTADQTTSTAQTGAQQTTDAWDVASLPAGAQKHIQDLRAEAAKYRTGSEQAAQTAAQKAQQDLTDKLAVALGLKQDAAQDPAALTASLTQAQEKATATERRLAVFTAAADTSQANALLNRLDFTNSIAGIDPTDAAAIKAAVDAAVAADPALKATRAVNASTADTTAGSGEGQPITEAQLAQMTPEEIVTALNRGDLKHLL